VSFLPLTGPEFVAFYVGLLAAVTIVAGIVRSRLRGPSGDPGQVQLDAYQAAFLAGGFPSGAQAALAALAGRGSLVVDPGGRFVAVEPRPAWLHPVEDAVWTAASTAVTGSGAAGAGAAWLAARVQQRAAARPAGLTPGQAATYERVEGVLGRLAQPRPGATAAALVAAARPALAPVEDQLRRLGFVMTDDQVRNVRTLPVLIVLAAAILGGVRLLFGMAAGRPVGYLIALLVLTLIVALLFLRRPTTPRTHRGDLVVRGLRQANAALRTNAVAAAAGLAGADLALAVGLWGPGVLSGGPLDDVRRQLVPVGSSGGGSDGGSSSCSSGGGSSCGGGCGGGCGG
jgi:uncharacterized protein (TIGR04222 family)